MGSPLLVAFFLLPLLCSTFTSEKKIQDVKIGALYRKETESLLRLLEYVIIYLLPRETHLPGYKFILSHVMVDGKDLLSEEVLSTFSQVVAIIDLACEDKKALDLSTLLGVPIMKVDPIEDTSSHIFAASIRPTYHVVNQALFDVMDSFSFSKVAVVYDVLRVREASHFYAKARRWPRFDIQMIPELILHDREQLRKSLKWLLKSHIKNIILFCDERDLTAIMNEALFVGMNDNNYRWITCNLEVAGPDQTYPSILGMVGLRLHLSNSQIARMLKLQATKEHGVEYSLSMYAAVHDAALVVGKAVENLLLSSDKGMQMIAKHIGNMTCPLHSAGTQHEKGLGWKLLQQIRKVKFQGLTGEVQFNMITGERRVHNGLDILNVVQHNVKKIGSWQPETGIGQHHVSLLDNKKPLWVGDFAEFVKCHNPGHTGPREKEPIPVLSVTTVLDPPFVQKVNISSPLPTGEIPKELLQGFCIDLIEALSKHAKFHYKIYLHQSYGGLVEELKKKKKDIALAPITITADRELIIDFSKPFMDFSMSLIMHKPGEPPINIFAFLLPFTSRVWLSTIGVVLCMTLVMYAMDYLSPYGYHARARESDDESGNEFNLLNSLWFATASILQQGPDNTPLAPSGRLLVSTFWFFILILISTYTANLAAFFTIKQTVATINSLKELENQTEIEYGVLDNGSVYTFFKNSGDPLYRSMFSHMREHTVQSTAEGVEKARKEKYAYITEQPYLEYYNQQQPCNTRLLNNLLQTKGYGIGLQKNSPCTNEISVAILELRESGFIERTHRKWWDERSQCPQPSQSKTGNTKSLGVNNMAGVFLVLLGGVVISLILVIVEIRYKKFVVYFTNGQTTLEPSRMSCESGGEPQGSISNSLRGESREPIGDPVRVAVVLSQGNRVLRPDVKKKPKQSGWNNWLNKN